MNKPAPKEPSMDEILSSIRQIIADDDAAAAPRKPSIPGAPASPQAAAPRPIPTMAQPRDAEPEPLALTAAQMLHEEAEEEEPTTALSFSDILGGQDEPSPNIDAQDPPQLVDPEDVAFEPEDVLDPAPVPSFVLPSERPSAPRVSSPPLANPMPINPVPRFAAPTPQPAPSPRPIPSVARAAPMPDPTLSRDMAEQLLAPTTDSAVKHTLAKLNGVSTVAAGVTIDSLMREMLRPMLKEWLDENLPSVVERMVEKEIARISRGGE
jgi:cell pole-organizing protein PopZ